MIYIISYIISSKEENENRRIKESKAISEAKRTEMTLRSDNMKLNDFLHIKGFEFPRSPKPSQPLTP